MADRWPTYSKVRFRNDHHRAQGVPEGSVGYVIDACEDGYEIEVSDCGTGRILFVGGVPDFDLDLITGDESKGVDAEDVLLTLADKFIADVEATTILRPTCSIGQTHGEVPEWARPLSRVTRRRHLQQHPNLIEIMLRIGGRGQGATVERALIDEYQFPVVLAHIADEWSELVGEELVEAADIETARTWPKCASHDHAMDPTVQGGRAWWTCRDDNSIQVLIGELASR